MHVVVTGGAGFLGSRLARELLASGTLEVAGRAALPLSRLTLIDRVPAPPDLSGPRYRRRPTAQSVPVGRAAAAANSRSSTASVTRLTFSTFARHSAGLALVILRPCG